jgi:predicted Holliday junction resolvase-like endonuclease
MPSEDLTIPVILALVIGSLVDYIMSDGLTRVADDKGEDAQIVFMDVNKGSGTLTRT